MQRFRGQGGAIRFTAVGDRALSGIGAVFACALLAAGLVPRRSFGFCGDGVRDDIKQCAGQDLDKFSCDDFCGSGALRCNVECTFDRRSCAVCGNGVKNGAEACDGSNLGGPSCPYSEGRASDTCATTMPACVESSYAAWNTAAVAPLTRADGSACDRDNARNGQCRIRYFFCLNIGSRPVSVIDVTPACGQAGTLVTIAGTGFGLGTAGGNTVRFDGLRAFVALATSTQIVVGLPVGVSTSGAIMDASPPVPRDVYEESGLAVERGARPRQCADSVSSTRAQEYATERTSQRSYPDHSLRSENSRTVDAVSAPACDYGRREAA